MSNDVGPLKWMRPVDVTLGGATALYRPPVSDIEDSHLAPFPADIESADETLLLKDGTTITDYASNPRDYVLSIPNYPTISSPIEFLHSRMQTVFYKALLSAVREEFQNAVDYTQQLAVIYNLDAYLGSQNEFNARVNNLMSYLGVTSSFALRDQINQQSASPLFPEWDSSVTYYIGDIIYYVDTDGIGDNITGYYSCLVEHIPVGIPTFSDDLYHTVDGVAVLYWHKIEEASYFRGNSWVRNYLNAIGFIRQVSGTEMGYRMIPHLLFKRGTYFIKGEYPVNPDQNTLIDGQMVKFVDESSIPRLLPTNVNTIYPSSGTLFGNSDFNTLPKRYYRYDTLLKLDQDNEDLEFISQEWKSLTSYLIGRIVYIESIPGDITSRTYYKCIEKHASTSNFEDDLDSNFWVVITSIRKFDTGIQPPPASSKGLLIELTLDEILTHQNTLGTYSCLLDLPWLTTMEQFTKEIARASDDISLGSQINLAALNTGNYTATVGDAGYSYPDIQAKIKQFPNNFTYKPSYMRMGAGILSDSELNETLTNIKSPLLIARLGRYDINIKDEFLCLTPVIHNFNHLYTLGSESDISQESPTVLIDDKSSDPATLSIPLSHKNISDGTLNIEIKFMYGSTYSNQIIPHKLIVNEKYNEPENKYDPVLELRKQEEFNVENWAAGIFYVQATDTIAADMVFYPPLQRYYTCIKDYEDDHAEVTFLEDLSAGYWRENDWKIVELRHFIDYLQKNDTYADVNGDYFPWESGSGIDFLQLPEYTDSYGNDTLVYVDRVAGTLFLRMKVSSTGPFAAYGSDSYYYTADVSYSINSNPRGGYVAITEVGVFTEDDKLMAYGTFPAIIYDASKYHLSPNIFLQVCTVFTATAEESIEPDHTEDVTVEEMPQ